MNRKRREQRPDVMADANGCDWMKNDADAEHDDFDWHSSWQWMLVIRSRRSRQACASCGQVECESDGE